VNWCCKKDLQHSAFACLLKRSVTRPAGTIYLYFKDRDELVLEIRVQGFAELSKELKSATDVADPLTRLVALLRAYAEFAVNSPETYPLSKANRLPANKRTPYVNTKLGEFCA
jgi:AcrR family transcriptional regulator